MADRRDRFFLGWSPANLDVLADTSAWRTVAHPARHRFLADPFYSTDSGAVLAEAMRRDGIGEIVAVADGECSTLPIGGGHCSYPATFAWEGRHFVMPEISRWSSPRLYELGETGIEDHGEIAIDGAPRLIDPTLFARGDCFLFGNRADEGDRILRLWVGESPFGPFAEHHDSPIRISPLGARMGGGILDHTGGLYRPGQDLSRGYGDGIVLFRIDELSLGSYRESEVARLRFGRHRGPHTLNIRGGKALFDYYDDRLHPLAGLRRLRQRRAR